MAGAPGPAPGGGAGRRSRPHPLRPIVAGGAGWVRRALFGPELVRKANILRCRCGNFVPIPEDDALLLRAEAALAAGRDGQRYLLACDERGERWEYLMAECRFHAGDYPAARAHYHRCVDAFDVRPRLEICCREMGDYQMAYYYAKM